MLNKESNDTEGIIDKHRKRRLAVVFGIALSSIVAVTSLAYKQDAAYVPRQQVGPGVGLSGDSISENAEAATGTKKPVVGPGAETIPETIPEKKPEAGPGQEQQTDNEPEKETASEVKPEEQQYIVQSGGRSIDLRKPMIALTFDDGPDLEVGNEIMDSLEKYNGRATFFLVGERVPKRKSIVKRMADNGHELGNHSMNHKNLKKQNADEIRRQIEECNRVIEEAAGVRPVLMRLPGGNYNELVMSNVNMPVILWNIDTRDWATKNAAKTVAAVDGKVKDGDIVLMHELYGQTAEAVRLMLPKLKEQGFQFVTVSELIRFKSKSVEPNKVYYHFHP